MESCMVKAYSILWKQWIETAPKHKGKHCFCLGHVEVVTELCQAMILQHAQEKEWPAQRQEGT